MKFNKNILVLVVLFLFVLSNSFFANIVYGGDTPNEGAELTCGTVLTPEDVETIKKSTYYGKGIELAPKALEALKAPMGIPLAIHVVRRFNGTGGLSVARVNQAVVDTNANYESTGMRFFLDGNIDYINNDTYYDINNMAEADALRNIYNIANRVNLYFVNYALGYCGFSTFSWYTVQGIIIANGCAGLPSNPSTVPHEIGHYFDLYHTHETAFGIEFVNGTNCTTAGDLLCDTPADPNLSGKVDLDCIYTGGELDPNGDPYDPDPHNLLSYSRKTCRDYTSPQQDAKQVNTLYNNRPELLVLPDIKANGFDGPLNLNLGSPVTVKVSLNSGVRNGDAAEWYVAAFTPFGDYWFTLASGWVKSATPLPVGGGANAFFDLSPYTVLDSYIMMVSGYYLFGIALDSNVNGALDLQYYDIVEVTVH